MIDLKNKKIIGLTIVSIIIFIASIFLYKQNSSNAFKEEYMTEIFTEESNDNMEYDSSMKENTDNSNENNLEKNKIVVEIKGEVARPDVYQLEEGSIIKDLIDMAGGVTEEADLSCINRAEELVNHELIIIGNINNIPILFFILFFFANIKNKIPLKIISNINIDIPILFP